MFFRFRQGFWYFGYWIPTESPMISKSVQQDLSGSIRKQIWHNCHGSVIKGIYDTNLDPALDIITTHMYTLIFTHTDHLLPKEDECINCELLFFWYYECPLIGSNLLR